MFSVRTFKGGVHIKAHKHTGDFPTVKMRVPDRVIIPMLQHIGAACVPMVGKGDAVKAGQKIGDSEAYVSSPVHSSVSGVVLNVGPCLYPGGMEVPSVEIQSDGKQEYFEGIGPPEGDLLRDKAGILKAVRESGLVGLGGAGFPTHVKLSVPAGKNIQIVLINGAECEPFITSDYREMLENTERVIEGIRTVKGLMGAQKALLCIEGNKPHAVGLYKSRLAGAGDVEVVSLGTRYPQGAEKQLIYAVTGRKVPAGALPADVGVLVQNINTVSFLSEYLRTGVPLIKRRITVDGSAVAHPANVEVPVGTRLRDVFEFCGGFKKAPAKIVMGGPMMGIAQFSLETPVLKQTNAILAFGPEDAGTPAESVCIRCGKCVGACPMNLTPLLINSSVVRGDFEAAASYHAGDCIECGCCSYVCPAKRHLVQSIRLAKAQLRRKKQGAV